MASKATNPIAAPDAAGIARAAALLRDGALVAIPTETVYGLAARADDATAVAAIYRAKGRPSFNPLIVHCADAAMAETYAHFDERARRLASHCWPGPLTLVLTRRSDASLAEAVTAGLPTVALRVPAHQVARAVLVETGLPLAAPSANRSGAISPSRAEHVAASLGSELSMVLDGGATDAGLESTIVALREDGWSLLRPGPIALDELTMLMGAAPLAASKIIEAPGQLTQHYAPGKPLRLNALDAALDEFHIGFGAVRGTYSLSDGDLHLAAAHLYEALHRAAASPHPRIAIAPIPDADIGAAINDRLRRAAA